MKARREAKSLQDNLTNVNQYHHCRELYFTEGLTQARIISRLQLSKHFLSLALEKETSQDFMAALT
jgi:DNA-binding transcriptional regulator LsrR (DeoR family)